MSRAVRKQIFKKLEELCSENQKIITDVIAEAQLQDTLARCQNMAVDIGTQMRQYMVKDSIAFTDWRIIVN